MYHKNKPNQIIISIIAANLEVELNIEIAKDILCKWKTREMFPNT